ncbi:MAG: SDR family NAD(P)-dependent oxidoreductase [Pseudomonadota bacterium]
MELEGKTAFITGGAGGIGLAMAQAFLSEGMDVAIADVDPDALADAVAQLSGTNGKVKSYQLDVTNRDQFSEVADQVEADFETVHVVCNNAGVYRGGVIDSVTYEDWDWVMGVNVGGVINGVQTWIKRIQEHGQGGHIVNTASMAGMVTSPGLGVYNTSKFAVVGMTEAMRDDLAESNIGVSVLCPGMVRTRILESERTRPDVFEPSDNEAVSAAQAHSEVMNMAMNAGIPAEEVAQLVVAGIKDNLLYLFPHPELKPSTQARVDAILEAFGEPDPERVKAQEEFLAALLKDQVAGEEDGRA